MTTTPPDTPKPPAELFIIPPQGREVVGDAFVDAGTATRAMKDRKASTVHRYILAPSPQEWPRVSQALIDHLSALLDRVEASKKVALTLDERESIEGAINVLCKLPRMPK